MDNLDFSLVPRRIAETLGADIVFGRIEPDSRVIEDDIAERFGVSRSPVRESIRLLERDGLVVRAERRGARVSSLNRQDLDEVYACRIELEGVAAAQAAAKHSKTDLKRLQAAVTRLQKAFQQRDIQAYFEANVAFTDTVHQAAGNATLTRLLGMLGKQALRYRYLAYRNFPHLMSASLEGNRDVIEAITQRNEEAARRETEKLIRKSWQTIRDCVPN